VWRGQRQYWQVGNEHRAGLAAIGVPQWKMGDEETSTKQTLGELRAETDQTIGVIYWQFGRIDVRARQGKRRSFAGYHHPILEVLEPVMDQYLWR
jgi:hypothetical protein